MKTINVIKKVFISAIVLTMVIAFAFSFNVIVKAAPKHIVTDKLAIESVDIKTNGNQGMRFKVIVDDTLNELDLHLYGRPRFGVVIAYGTTDTSIELNMTINDKKVISGQVKQLDEDNCYYITLYNIPKDGYIQNISVRPYIKYWDGYIYGSETKVYNLTTVAYKAMNDGTTSSLLTDVDTYMNANYKKVYLDAFGNLVFDDFKETNPEALEELFINDINQYLENTLTTDSSVNDWVTQLQYNTSITDSKLYQAYNTTKFNNKWSWLFDYLGNYGHIKTNQQVSRLGNNVVPGTDYNNFKNLIYSLYNFFHCEALDSVDSIPFNTEESYSTLTTSNIYPELDKYDDVRKIGTTSTLGYEDAVLGYTVNDWKLNATDYLTTDNYTVPSNNTKMSCGSKTCHVSYDIDDDEVKIWGINGDVSDLVILPEYEGYPTRYIYEYSFAECTSLKSISIPDTVTEINVGLCIYCPSITSITVDPNNTVYDSRNDCNAIIETATNTLIKGCINTVIPNSVKYIGAESFEGSGLTSITIPNSVTYIGYRAFADCTSLTSITIPNGVTTIQYYAFAHCESLTSITIPSSVTYIGNEAFVHCSYIENITVDSDNTVYDSRNNCNAIIETATNKLIQGCNNTVIPNTVKSIGSYAFSYLSITNITIPNSVTSIGGFAFYGCESLTSITLSNTLTSIGAASFGVCKALTSIIIPISVTSILDGAFIYSYSLKIYCEAKKKPSGWTSKWNERTGPVTWGYTGQ